jgi:hypothetical protein
MERFVSSADRAFARVARSADDRAWAWLAGFTVLYIACTIARSLSKPLWFDELFTFYISGIPTWKERLAQGGVIPPVFAFTVQMFFPHLIHVGSNVRIDCFGLLGAGPEGSYIGGHVHIAAGVYPLRLRRPNRSRVVLESFCNRYSRVAVYSANDPDTEGYLRKC